MITCGVDIGSRSIEVVLLNGNTIQGYAAQDTGAFPTENATTLFYSLLEKHTVARNELSRVIATGYGRNYFSEADRVASEILCHAAGTHFYFPEIHTIIDIGGQDSKIIQTDPQGKVINFVMNDRCAAGTGKFIEMVAKTLAIPMEDTGPLALSTNESCEISSMCAVFAESEIIGLLHKGIQREVILRGVFKSVAKRTLSMAGKIATDSSLVFTGGVALNSGVRDALHLETNQTILTPQNPQYTGALGAALIAQKDGTKSNT